MKIKMKTTVSFKARRLAGYTAKLMPEISEKSKTSLMIKWKSLNGDRLEREIFNSCIVLKNLSIVHRDLPMSADFILEQLMESSRLLKNAYADVLSAYRNGKGEEAFELLYAGAPVKAAKSFGQILSKIDRINPSELISHMTAFEEAFAAERVTRGMKRTERRSLVTTMMATASVFAILLNFTIVAVFMDTLTMLGQAF